MRGANAALELSDILIRLSITFSTDLSSSHVYRNTRSGNVYKST
jgi:hypothetical protein